MNRDGQVAVNDMGLAVVSLTSLRPQPASFAGWVIGVFRIRVRSFCSGFSRSFNLPGAVPGFARECNRKQAPDPGAAGGNLYPSGSRRWALGRLLEVTALKSREINHLQHATGA